MLDFPVILLGCQVNGHVVREKKVFTFLGFHGSTTDSQICGAHVGGITLISGQLSPYPPAVYVQMIECTKSSASDCASNIFTTKYQAISSQASFYLPSRRRLVARCCRQRP